MFEKIKAMIRGLNCGIHMSLVILLWKTKGMLCLECVEVL